MDKGNIKTTVSMVLPYFSGVEERFVYVKTAKDGKWGLPGGKLDLFENDQNGVVREVLQETGLDIVVVDFLGVWDFKSERGSSVSNRVYSGRVAGGELFVSRPKEVLELGALSGVSKLKPKIIYPREYYNKDETNDTCSSSK